MVIKVNNNYIVFISYKMLHLMLKSANNVSKII